MRLQRFSIVIDPRQHHGRNRKDHPRRRELPLRQNMMYQAAVEPAIAILEGMDVNESERSCCGFQHRIERGLAHPVICINEAKHQVIEVLRARANELRKRITLIVAFANKNPLLPEPRAHKSTVFNQYSVQSDNLV